MHRILEFIQSQWLKKYVEFNTQKRIESGKKMVIKMKKALYKLMNFASYGKTINITRKKTTFPSEKDD